MPFALRPINRLPQWALVNGLLGLFATALFERIGKNVLIGLFFLPMHKAIEALMQTLTGRLLCL